MRGAVTPIINAHEPAGSWTTRGFEGDEHGGAAVSFFLSDAPPGSDPNLHTHPYAEVFVTPSGTPDKFVSFGTGTLGWIIIHPDERMTTEWIEDT